MSEVQQVSLFDDLITELSEPTTVMMEALAIGQTNEETVEETMEVVPYEIGDRVHVFISPDKEKDVEAFYYLGDFQGKRGTIAKIIPLPLLQYEVEVGEKIAHVYHDEVRVGWPK